MKHILSTIGTTLCALLMASCTQDSPKTDMSNVIPVPTPPVIDMTDFPRGADVSWLTKMENDNLSFYDNRGNAIDCMKLLRLECGVNAIRLRVFVNPKDGWCNADDVRLKANRAKALNMRVMIDFHFSDSWADPGKQRVPEAWRDLTIEETKAAIANHVTDVLTALKNDGISPEWVQIGNETTDGMLYESADAYSDIEDNAWKYKFYDGNSGYYTNAGGKTFAEYVNAGYDAVKALLPDCKVIVHVDHGDYMGRYNKIFGALKNNNARYDLIGISCYPGQDPDGSLPKKTWEQYTTDVANNIKMAYNLYGKETMIVEYGMAADEADDSYSALKSLMTAASYADSHIKGIFYWEPQAEQSYNGYKEGCFSKGRPTKALSAFTE